MLPLAATVPIPLSIETVVAFVVFQARVALAPVAMLEGEAERAAVIGVGAVPVPTAPHPASIGTKAEIRKRRAN